jgi:hypothetical protein
MPRTDLATIKEGIKIGGKLYDHISSLPGNPARIRMRKSRGKIPAGILKSVLGGIWVRRSDKSKLLKNTDDEQSRNPELGDKSPE